MSIRTDPASAAFHSYTRSLIRAIARPRSRASASARSRHVRFQKAATLTRHPRGQQSVVARVFCETVMGFEGDGINWSPQPYGWPARAPAERRAVGTQERQEGTE